MTTIIVGSGNFFKSTTAEGHLLEICTYLQNQERNVISNPTNKDFVQVSYNLNSMVTAINFAIPAEQSIDSAGKIITSATDYLQGITFIVGEGNTFKSTTLTQYFQEVITFLQIKEGSITTNPQLVNNISSSYDGDSKVLTGSITLPLSIGFDSNGHPIVSAIEYLL